MKVREMISVKPNVLLFMFLNSDIPCRHAKLQSLLLCTQDYGVHNNCT